MTNLNLLVTVGELALIAKTSAAALSQGVDAIIAMRDRVMFPCVADN